MERIKTIDQLVLAAKRGFHIKSPEISYLTKWTKAESLMSFSVRGIQRAIDKGLVCKELEAVTEQLDALQECKDKLRASGLSYGQISERLGITIQAVGQFMKAQSVSTRTISKYLGVLK